MAVWSARSWASVSSSPTAMEWGGMSGRLRSFAASSATSFANGSLLPCTLGGPFPSPTAGRATAAVAMACSRRRRLLPQWSNSQSNMQPRIPEIDYFVYGHLHILRNEPVGANSRMVVLGDWISLNSWAEFDGKELVLKQNV